ncbi:2-oxo acid dehydrogenase subunit E2 [uncultured Oscillibacter sp.]|uniref:2-oxo acid dehydrogenase subunit E2 n=1 Tax=uncultured Oscillibacter sp. TaxID=876091 RepID=UPI002633BFA9|nr:2-oxo acid dehydrogenase subunit E2 [uncultured Oscillibacter sp.]
MELRGNAAIGQGMAEEMRRDKDIVMIGLDLRNGGAFGVSRGMVDEFGPERIVNMPISEAGFTGMGVGAAAAGLRPVVELMYNDWATIASDQIINQAASLRYMFGGSIRVPLVVRMPCGGYVREAGQHSHMLESWFSFIPGLKVAAPSTPIDAKAMVKGAIRDNNPVIFFEHKKLYTSRGEVSEDPDYVIPLGRADVKREGRDVSVFCYAYMVRLALLAEEGKEYAVGTPICAVGAAGEALPSGLSAVPPVQTDMPQEAVKAEIPPEPEQGGRIKITPLAKKIAAEHRLDCSALRGSGEGGRIRKEDVLAALEKAAASIPAADEEDEAQPMSRMRRTIASRMSQSKSDIPHTYFKADIDMMKAIHFRAEAPSHLDPGLTKYGVNEILLKAAALALRSTEGVNVSLRGNEIIHHRRIHLGMAVSVPYGLVVPVIQDADRLSLAQLGRTATAYAEQARNGTLPPEALDGSTFTVSSLGRWRIPEFTAIINPPNAAILAVGAVRDEAVVVNGEIAVRAMLHTTLSIDHRVIDGALAAEYLMKLKEILEHPYMLLVN